MYKLFIDYNICDNPEKCGYCQSKLSIDFHQKHKEGLLISERAFEENKEKICGLLDHCDAINLILNENKDDNISN